MVRCCPAVGGGPLLLRYGKTGGARLSACSSDRVDQHASREVVARAGGGEGVRGRVGVRVRVRVRAGVRVRVTNLVKVSSLRLGLG